ncbi:MAG: hypothetical protein LBU20_00550 [Candidatus Nomurabacteria bacterium]|jgi:lipid A disaccharide synthetase|nr:hypothetical protein [Candidatus Nomurabacteria bacterium]
MVAHISAKKPIICAFIDSPNLNLGVLYDIKKRGKAIIVLKMRKGASK